MKDSNTLPTKELHSSLQVPSTWVYVARPVGRPEEGPILGVRGKTLGGHTTSGRPEES